MESVWGSTPECQSRNSGRNLESDSGPPGMILYSTASPKSQDTTTEGMHAHRWRAKPASLGQGVIIWTGQGSIPEVQSKPWTTSVRNEPRSPNNTQKSSAHLEASIQLRFHASPGGSGKEVDSLVDKFDYSTVMESAPLAMACRPHFVLVSSERYIIQVGGGSGFDSRDTWIVVQWLKILSRQEGRNHTVGAPTSLDKMGKEVGTGSIPEKPRRLVHPPSRFTQFSIKATVVES
ncbi:hypothetical protein B0H11DRAFT_1913388 [Mycena galericulata]|nr:hypothetical protein B0H11DRAFT_1913388 [Mycena galericulata]